PEARAHGVAVQRAVRPRAGGGGGRLPAVHEAVRRWAVGRRDADREPGGAARAVRRLGRAADAPAGGGRAVRGVRALALDRRRDDRDAVPPGGADARALLRRTRLPRLRDRLGRRDDLAARERVLPLGVRLLR